MSSLTLASYPKSYMIGRTSGNTSPNELTGDDDVSTQTQESH